MDSRIRRTLGFLAIAALVLSSSLSGCSLSASFAVDSDGVRGPFAGGVGSDEAQIEAPEPAYDRAHDAGATARGEAEPVPVGSVSPEAQSLAVADGTPPQEPDATPGERMRVSTGSLELTVARVDRARGAIIEYVARVGGYVERSTADTLVVRVPADRFDAAMTRVEELGEVRSRVVEIADVTEAFADLERRLEIAVASRERLYELLERAESSSDDADERVAILREIRRLTEEIEGLRSALDALGELVAYSRISVRLVSRIETTQAMRRSIPFPWIARLDPLDPSVGEAAGRIELEMPADFAVLAEGRRVRAESADGTRIRAGGRPNEPAGDAVFWSEALAFHLGDFYRSTDPVDAGAYSGVVFESRDREPYFYLVAIAPRGDELLVVEAFFPTLAARDEHLEPISRMLEGGRP